MLFFEKIVKYDAPYGRNVPLRGMCCFAECGRFAHQPRLHIGEKRPYCTKCITLRAQRAPH